MAQYRVLAAIDAGDQRATRIAERLALGKPAISATVEGLCNRGLLERAPVEADQRASSLRLTTKGAATLEAMERSMCAWMEEVCSLTGDSGRALCAFASLGEAIETMARRNDGPVGLSPASTERRL